MPGSQYKQEVLSILLVDRLPIRRSSVALLLERWAQTYQTPFRLVEPAKGDAEIPEPFDLALLSIGGTSAASPEVQAQITGFTSVAGSKPVAVLADDDDAADVIAAVRAGASGYISQRIEPDVMFRALKFIASGGVFFPPKALLSNADANADVRVSPLPRIDPAAAHLTNALTCRQSDVLQLLLRGQTNKCIARELRMRESTVKVHVRQIMRKLGASNRTQAALFARQADGAGLSMGHSTPA